MNIHSRALAAMLAASLLAATVDAWALRAVQTDSPVKGREASTAADDERGAGWRGWPLEELRREQRRRPDAAVENYNLGAALYAGGLYEEAVGFLARAARLDARFAAPRRTLGLACFKLARYPEAAEAFRQLTLLQPRLAEGHNNLGVARAKAGRYREAVAALREAVRLETAYAEARFNLGAALVELSEREAAVEQHAALLTLDAALAGKLFRLIHKDKLVDAGSR